MAVVRSPSPIAVRRARPDDLDEVVAVGARVFAPYGHYRETLLRWLTTEGVVCLVADHEERFGGAVLLAFYPVGPRTLDAELLAIEVTPDQQRRGIGTALLDEALALARRIGDVHRPVRAMRLSTAHDNAVAIALFERYGFAPTGESLGRYDGGQTIVRMECRFTD